MNFPLAADTATAVAFPHYSADCGVAPRRLCCPAMNYGGKLIRQMGMDSGSSSFLQPDNDIHFESDASEPYHNFAAIIFGFNFQFSSVVVLLFFAPAGLHFFVASS